MNHRFKVVFEKESDRGYSVHVPALPGCASQGDTFEEARENIQEAMRLYLWSLKEDGLPVPENGYGGFDPRCRGSYLTRMLQVSGSRLIRALEGLGFYVKRHTGGHAIVVH